MSDRDALLAAIRAQPDEDTPRLIFADWLEENGAAERAAFIRAQVELARTPPWEPFAVRCRWRQPDVSSGKPFLSELPQTRAGSPVAWESRPFRRGFGWAIEVRVLGLWGELAEPLFDEEPIGKITFWHGLLDDWLHVAQSERVRHFRELTFNLNPGEPMRALRDREAACGITDLRFHRASSAGLPEVMEDLLMAPLGRAVRGLHFRVGNGSLNELLDALNTGPPREALSFAIMGLTADHLRRLFDGPAASALSELHLRDEPLGYEGLAALADVMPAGLTDLTLSSVELRGGSLEPLARCAKLESVRRLNLSRNPLTPRALRALSQSRSLAGLRSLDLSGCRIGDKGVRRVTRSRFWPNLVELDLRQNPVSAVGVKYLLDAPRPSELTALVLDDPFIGSDDRAALARKYGDAAVFTPGELGA